MRVGGITRLLRLKRQPGNPRTPAREPGPESPRTPAGEPEKSPMSAVRLEALKEQARARQEEAQEASKAVRREKTKVRRNCPTTAWRLAGASGFGS